jgi:hypothetical protein
MFDARRALVWLLRLYGAVALAAVVPVGFPVAWMAGLHEWLGLGPYPRVPIVDYLARSLSALYALSGGLLLLVAGDVARHRATIAYVGWAAVALGVVLPGIDLHAGMPAHWTLREGALAAYGGAILWLLRSVPASVQAPPCAPADPAEEHPER